MSVNRWGDVGEDTINEQIDNLVPKNTTINKQSQWRQFMDFCKSKNFEINENTTVPEIASILKSWAFNMKRKDGTDYKEAVIKTLWNNIAKTLQEMYFKQHNLKFNPFEDIEFIEARKARDSKRKQLQGISNKRKVSAAAFTMEEHNKMQKVWDENTPEGLQKKFYIIASKELAWRGNEAVNAKTYHFQIETSNRGTPTGRIIYNPIFSKTNQGGNKICAENKWLVENSINEFFCPVRLYKKLMEKRPKTITTERLFLTPNRNWQSSVWYKNIPIGLNNLSSWTKKTAEKIGLDTLSKKFTNHSNRSTAVTHLANANVPEQQLMKITGHTNSNSIKTYLQMQSTHHEEIINSMRKAATSKERNGSLPKPTNDITISSNMEQNQPQCIYNNCVFNVQNMYCCK